MYTARTRCGVTAVRVDGRATVLTTMRARAVYTASTWSLYIAVYTAVYTVVFTCTSPVDGRAQSVYSVHRTRPVYTGVYISVYRRRLQAVYMAVYTAV